VEVAVAVGMSVAVGGKGVDVLGTTVGIVVGCIWAIWVAVGSAVGVAVISSLQEASKMIVIKIAGMKNSLGILRDPLDSRMRRKKCFDSGLLSCLFQTPNLKLETTTMGLNDVETRRCKYPFDGRHPRRTGGRSSLPSQPGALAPICHWPSGRA